MDNLKKMILLLLGGTLILVIVVLVGLWNMKHPRIKDKTEEKASPEVTEEAEAENGFDWDAYFNSGGYFGDYGDESISYELDQVNSIFLQAEYATVHIQSSKEVSDFQVFTQIGSDQDAISCNLYEGTLQVIQANLNENTASDGSYIEIIVPAGKAITNLTVKASNGVSSIKLDNYIMSANVEMDYGTVYIDSMLCNECNFKVGEGIIRATSLHLGSGELICDTGNLRIDSLEITDHCDLKLSGGTVQISMDSKFQGLLRTDVTEDSSLTVSLVDDEIN